MTIKYLVVDVDGTLTDSGVYYDNHGNELKKFSTKDGVGFAIAHAAGIKIIILTGRESAATLRRMTELNVDVVAQSVESKSDWLRAFMSENAVARDEIAYIGDDVNDLPSMKLCGVVCCPHDACREVKAIANYISPVEGGHGAVRDCAEYLLTDSWTALIEQVYGSAGV